MHVHSKNAFGIRRMEGQICRSKLKGLIFLLGLQISCEKGQAIVGKYDSECRSAYYML